MAVSNISGFTTRSDGNKITASIWNSELGGIYTYLNNTIVPVFNLLAAKGSILSHDGSNILALAIGATDGHTLQVDAASATGMRWASAGGLPTTTKGDIIVHNGTTNVRKAIGANGTVLTADNTQADGTKWATVGSIFQSSDQTITSSALYTIAHGLGSTPRNAWFALVCQTAELGYSVGDVVFTYAEGELANRGLTITADATNLECQIANHNSPLTVIDRTTGGFSGITRANWKLRFFAQA